MKPIPWLEAAQRFGATPVGEGKPISAFATDSREVWDGSLFIAIRGAQVDGHTFVGKVLQSGAAGSLVEEPVAGPYLLVPNVVDALAKFANSYRREFAGPVVGITGSVGKTTTKELVAAALSPLGRVLATQGNRNTEFTAPLLWPEINEGDVASVVVEMGMRGFGQISHLAGFSQPSIGLITNIGHSHLELVKSREGIAKAKCELFDSLAEDAVAIAPAEDDFIDYLREQRRVETFGFGPSDARVIDYVVNEDWTTRSVIEVGEKRLSVRTPVGRHLALSAASALLVARAAGVDLKAAADAISNAKLPPMRMEMRHALGQDWMLDMYNAAPNSVKVALETLREMRGAKPIVLVLGEMRELGEAAESEHRQIGRWAADLGAQVIALNASSPDGPARFIVDEAGANAVLATSHAEVRNYLGALAPGHLILVKGSRAVALENALPSGVLS